MIRRMLFVAAALALLAPASRADVKPNPLFSDGMVLQQGANWHFWGTADPDEQISVIVQVNPDGGGIQAERTKADKNGNWSVTLPLRTVVRRPPSSKSAGRTR